MAQLDLINLQLRVDQILGNYSRFLNDELTAKAARSAIGFIISGLSEYECEYGMSAKRSITVLPNCSKIIDINVPYNTKFGRVLYKLNVTDTGKGTYQIHTNKIKPLENPAQLSVIKLDSNLSVKSASSRITYTPPKILSSKTFVCSINNANCCYTLINHDENCRSCCLNKDHYYSD